MSSRAHKKPAAKSRKSPRVARAKEPGLMARLAKGAVICAEGYVFELERRGYLQAGAFVPEVLIEHPEVVEQLHRDFVHAGSDVTQALTYYVHREKLRVIGREKDLLPMNRMALGIAKKVARETGTLFAGDICNTNIYDPADKKALKEVNRIFAEQVGWAAEAGVDYIVAETYSWGAEALLALEAIRKYSNVPAVVTVCLHREEQLRDGWSAAEACKRLEDAGADVVGLNCHRGPATMMPLLKEIRKAVRCHVAALPVPYRTTREQPSFMSLTDPCCGDARAFPTGLDPFVCTRSEMYDFGREALRSASTILASAVAPGRTIFARSPKGLADILRRANIPPICRGTPSSARIRRSRKCRPIIEVVCERRSCCPVGTAAQRVGAGGRPPRTALLRNGGAA
jgi:betaine-homocysteine S-methyltransferase